MGYALQKRASQAEDLLSFKGVDVCTTSRDLSSGSQHCPSNHQVITSCADAKTAAHSLANVKTPDEVGPLLPSTDATPPECELKTINASDSLYVIIYHAYYTGDQTVRTNALNQLYTTYSNYYSGYSLFDLTSPTPSSTLTPNNSLQPISFAALVTGEPGFLMSVTLQDENGQTRPGSGVHIKMTCGDATDMMTVEPNGNSWFSYAGYEKLHCGNQPLAAEAQVERSSSGQWLLGTPTYSYSFEPATINSLQFQNRPQPVQASFIGKWQGIGVVIQTQSKDVFGKTTSTPLSKTNLIFACTQDGVDHSSAALTGISDKKGRVFLSLADAQNAYTGCSASNFTARLSDYDPHTGASAKTNPTYDFFFANPGPIPVGQISGSSFTGASLVGQELEVGGRIRLADSGSIPGGYLRAASQICLFYSTEAAQANPAGCPQTRTESSISLYSDSQAQYLFSGTSRISYGDYLKMGSPAIELRILNFRGESYPASTFDANQHSVTPQDINVKDVHLPTSVDDLHNEVCLSVQQVWNMSQCAAVFHIIDHESNWKVDAENPSSHACGLFQTNPCSKAADTALPGEPYVSIGNTMNWGIQYIKTRYQSPNAAWAFWQTHANY